MGAPQRAGLRESLEKSLASLVSAQYGLFTRRQSRERGVSDGMLRHALTCGRVERVSRTVYRLTAAQPSWHQSVLAACLSAGEESYASHRTAGRLWELEGITQAPIELTTAHDVRSGPRTIIHRVEGFPACDVQRDAIPVTQPARTLLDLASVLRAEELELALDSALRRRLLSVPRLRWQLDHFGTRGRAGAGNLRELLEARPTGDALSESGLETRLFRLISTAGLPPPTRQYEIRDGQGFVARVDLAYPSQRLAIEADGYRYHSGQQVWERDLARRNALGSLGWMLLHFSFKQVVHRGGEVISTIASALERRNFGAKWLLYDHLAPEKRRS